ESGARGEAVSGDAAAPGDRGRHGEDRGRVLHLAGALCRGATAGARLRQHAGAAAVLLDDGRPDLLHLQAVHRVPRRLQSRRPHGFRQRGHLVHRKPVQSGSGTELDGGRRSEVLMILEVSGIACAYDGTDVLSDVTVRLSPGDFTAVAGPNGSGKSTLIRALRPRLGSALLEGQDLYALPARDSARAIAVLPQESALEFEFSCEEVVLMGRAPHLGRFETESERDRAVVREAMERTSTWE